MVFGVEILNFVVEIFKFIDRIFEVKDEEEDFWGFLGVFSMKFCVYFEVIIVWFKCVVVFLNM